jgi:hypothetical protein
VVYKTRFQRGDSNTDGTFNIGDAIFVLSYLFSAGGTVLTCADASDSNDDGAVDIADAIYALQFLFSGGPPPPPPFSECGRDDGASAGCDGYDLCD